MTTIINTNHRPLPPPAETATQLESAASHLRCAARELETLNALPAVENTAYWEWDQHQSGPSPVRLPLEFTHWTLMREAEQLEARARALRGERNG